MSLSPASSAPPTDSSGDREELTKQIRKVGRVTTDIAEKTRREGAHIDLSSDAQQVVLLNTAHRGLATRSQEAAFRILGLFPNAKEAIEAAADFPQDVAIYLHPTHKFKYLGPETISEEEELSKIDRMHERCSQQVAQSKRDFEERMKHSSEPLSEPFVPPPKKEDDGKEAEEGQKEGESIPERIRRIHELRDQSYAAVGIILDEGTSECCFTVFRCFDDAEECERYVVNTLSDHVKNYELFVVRMYEWLFPFQVAHQGGAQRVGYRHVQLHDIMTHKREQKTHVEEYLKRCESEGMTPAITEIDESGVVSKSDLIAASDGAGEGEEEKEKETSKS